MSLWPRLEWLERRVVLSPMIFMVNSTGNGTSGSGDSGTLPYVVGLANANTSSDGSEIEFQPSAFSSAQTITLSATLVLSETGGPELIDGTGVGPVTVSGGGTSQVFEVDGNVAASISGLTISGGFTTGNGGGLENDGTATLTDCTISGNTADGGGGLFNSYGASLTVQGSTFSGNSAGDAGGGLENYGTATLTACTISGNSAVFGGGGLDNQATATLTACTISGNSAVYSGGGVGNESSATLMLTACTISDNSASVAGGGLYNTSSATATLTDTIVAGNITQYGPSDIGGFEAGQVTGNYNLIGTGGSGGVTGGSDGNIVLTSLSSLGLATLGDYGGTTETMALLPGSAALGMGTAVSGATTDQRGLPLDSPPDIGAFESQGFTLTLVAGGTNQETTDGTAFANPLAVVVTANNPIEPVVGGTVAFTPPSSGASAGLTAGTATIGADDIASVMAADNSIAGSYTVTASASPAATVSFSLTNLVSSLVSDYTVNTTSGGFSGSGSSGTLPYVIFLTNADANTSTDGTEIQFDSSVFSSPQTITLGATLVLSETSGPDVIDGPGPGLVTVSGGGTIRVFQIQSGVTASISGLTISGGAVTGRGGGLENYGTATVTDCTISGNSASSYGGGLDNNGTATIVGCTISGNSGTDVRGGGVANSGTATLTDCTISGNSASSAGGGMWTSGTATLTDCTISGNSVVDEGGGLYSDPFDSADTTLRSTIVADNTEAIFGGAASDIGGYTDSTSSYNLIGTGGSGGIANGQNGNIVLTTLAGLGLAPLGDYGGPTETIALLPGSPAIGAGAAVSGVTTDQRGEPLDSPPDIGAFQSQGFTLSVVAGSTPQQTTDGTAFANPLAVVVAANNPVEPVAGGTVTFAAPSSGASAALSAGTATIGANGTASVVAADNSIAGSYIVTAAASGAAPVSFDLTNLASSLVSNYTVNSTSGGFSGSGTSGTLPYVIFLTNADANPSSDGAEIQFDSSVFSSPQTITLGATLVLSETWGPIVIDGPGTGPVTVSGGGTVTVIQVDSGVTSTLSGLTISGGSTASNGGGIYNEGTLTITDSLVTNNQAIGSSSLSDGGGIYNDGTLTISDSSITDNKAGGFGFYNGGGGIFNDGTLTISDTTVANNSDEGVFNDGVLTINQSQFTGNTGAGLYQEYYGPMAVVTNSTFSSNAGDGIDNFSNMSIVNCTIADNSGYGINTLTGGGENQLLLTIEDCTIVDNGYDDLYNWDDTGPVTDVVVGNTIFGTINGDIESQGHNLIANSSEGLGFAPSDLLNVNPMLGPLQNNGGPTQTMALLPGSPAIDAGDTALVPAAVISDQRGAGYPRIVNSSVDIGAYEVQGPWHFVVTAQPPANVIAGSGFGLTVEALDSAGNVDTSFNGTVNLAIYNGPAGAVLGGTTTIAASGGVATFSGLTLDTEADGYSLVVSGSGEIGEATSLFNVTPTAATQLVVTTQPPGDVTAGSPFGLVVSAEDPFGNVDPTFDGSVTVALLDNPGGATLGARSPRRPRAVWPLSRDSP